jgi:hypothetical protein
VISASNDRRRTKILVERTPWEAHVIAFEDSELSEWLIQAIEEDPGQFLRALAEAAVIACPEDYCLVRPVLIRLKRRYGFSEASAKEPGRPTRGRRLRAQSFGLNQNELI